MMLDPLELTFFAVCSLVAVAGAVGTVSFPNPIRGALSLLFTLLAVAGLYLQLRAPMLAAIQLIVYVGAVVVLFLFVIMLLGPAATAPSDARGRATRVVGAIAASLLTALVLMVLAPKTFPNLPPVQAGYGTVEAIGDRLFGEYLVPFEAISFLLLVAIVGAVAIARGRQPDPQARPSLPASGAGSDAKTQQSVVLAKEDA